MVGYPTAAAVTVSSGQGWNGILDKLKHRCKSFIGGRVGEAEGDEEDVTRAWHVPVGQRVTMRAFARSVLLREDCTGLAARTTNSLRCKRKDMIWRRR